MIFFLATKFHSFKNKINIVWILFSLEHLKSIVFDSGQASFVSQTFCLQGGWMSSGEIDFFVEMPDTKWHLDDLKHSMLLGRVLLFIIRYCVSSCLHCVYKDYTKWQLCIIVPLNISMGFRILPYAETLNV